MADAGHALLQGYTVFTQNMSHCCRFPLTGFFHNFMKWE
ncbi:hypothetical protein GMO_15120 [Gluconobacter morbifer G707]|uniref:Uncharacterized protein n=1 Tax=Gluconobacter morbifer G707 TaxID=1088869 RepID=G6XJ46_9PROT|nr:hypothetical protein GMO_15120 [Gluconobacter morbifer G707]